MASSTLDRLQASASSVLLWAISAALLVAPAARAQDGCIADVDGDGIVNGNDLATVLVGWGSCAGCAGDINGNGVVNGEDLASVLVRWSGTCAPTVTGISPDAGPLAGGSVVTITGDRLLNPTSVTFGGTPATVVSSTRSTVSVMAPARPAGSAAVLVTTQGGSVSAGSFTYFSAPMIGAISPSIGPHFGGTVVTISGAGFYGDLTVRFGSVDATIVASPSSSQLTAISPPGVIDSFVDVSVTTGAGSATAEGAFNYVAGVVPSWATLIEAVPPADIMTNETLRSAIQASGYAWRIRDNATQIEMVLVPAGTFLMGCSTTGCAGGCGTTAELPVHSVTLSRDIYIGRYEVTQSQWAAVTGLNPSIHQGPKHPDAAMRPVENLSRVQIEGFLTATGLRLPTEAEWEYACRAGATAAYHSMLGFPNGFDDGALVDAIAWNGGNSDLRTHAVGGRAGNALGIHDMLGNVREHVAGVWYDYSAKPQIDPIGSGQSGLRVLRGGHFGENCSTLMCSTRVGLFGDDESAGGSVGFRVARNP